MHTGKQIDMPAEAEDSDMQQRTRHKLAARQSEQAELDSASWKESVEVETKLHCLTQNAFGVQAAVLG